MSLSAALVVTTINDPVVLSDYLDNFAQFGHLPQVTAYVIVDRKTPAAALTRLADIKARGLSVVAPDFDQQEAFLRRVGFDPSLVPYNSDNRRNIGYLMAYESGADFVISIDDDNFPSTMRENLFAEHARVCQGRSVEVEVSSNDGYLNICDMLEFSTQGPVYPRGYPYAQRHSPQVLKPAEREVDVHVNAGLWTREPDIDGISWLVAPPHATAMKGGSVCLAPDTWSPVNTQNTGLRREALGAYYFIRMGYPLGGAAIDRYGDIFSGYFLQACAKHLGGAIRIGTPVAEHRRNTHNYMNDATNEWACIQLLEDILPWMVQDLRLEGGTYLEAFDSLAEALGAQAEKFTGRVWTDTAKSYFHSVAYHMRAWTKACRTIDGAR